jgi:hypothetical protein
VVNSGADSVLNLDYFDTVAYGNLWEARCHRLNELGYSPFWERPEISIRFSNSSCTMLKPAMRLLAMKTDIQSVPREDWESTFRRSERRIRARTLMLDGSNSKE